MFVGSEKDLRRILWEAQQRQQEFTREGIRRVFAEQTGVSFVKDAFEERYYEVRNPMHLSMEIMRSPTTHRGGGDGMDLHHAVLKSTAAPSRASYLS